MNKVKLFVDCHVFDGNYQGTTTYLKGIYSELIKNRNIHFYFASYDTEALSKIFGYQDNITYIKYATKNKFLRLLFEIPKLISKNKIQYAHFQYVVPPLKKCKYILTIHDVLFLDFPQYFPLTYRLKNKFLFFVSAKLSDIIFSVSDYSAERIKKHFNLKEILVTKNAVDEVFLQEFNKVETSKRVKEKFSIENYFLFVSRIEPRKNHLGLLKVFVEKKYYQDYELVFVGNNAIRYEEFENYFESLDDSIKMKIKILNNIEFNDLVEITRAAKLSIYPSFAEGFGIPPLESVACGIPTVSSNTTAMNDFYFIKEFLFNPYSIDDFNSKILKALHDPKEENILSEMKKSYDWGKSAEVFYKRISK